VYVHLRAISSRCHLRIVSDVTIVAIREVPPTKALTDDRETPTVVIQPQSPAVQLRVQYAVLFPQEFDDIALLLFEPAEQRRKDQVQRKHSRSLR
jgi:hypothetical protein